MACAGFRDAKVKAAMTKVIPGEWGLGSVSGRTLQHTRVHSRPAHRLCRCCQCKFRKDEIEWCTAMHFVASRTPPVLQVPLLVVRPDAALKLNKLRITQPSMAPGSADQAGGAWLSHEQLLGAF
jgi:hypothetical protein